MRLPEHNVFWCSKASSELAHLGNENTSFRFTTKTLDEREAVSLTTRPS